MPNAPLQCGDRVAVHPARDFGPGTGPHGRLGLPVGAVVVAVHIGGVWADVQLGDGSARRVHVEDLLSPRDLTPVWPRAA